MRVRRHTQIPRKKKHFKRLRKNRRKIFCTIFFFFHRNQEIPPSASKSERQGNQITIGYYLTRRQGNSSNLKKLSCSSDQVKEIILKNRNTSHFLFPLLPFESSTFQLLRFAEEQLFSCFFFELAASLIVSWLDCCRVVANNVVPFAAGSANSQGFPVPISIGAHSGRMKYSSTTFSLRQFASIHLSDPELQKNVTEPSWVARKKSQYKI